MPKHSPAPWYQGRDINGMMIICQEYDGRCNYVDENPEYQSNCRLIDAAPDLLAFVAEWLSSQGGDINYMTEKARSVIAKATGEQP